MSAQGLQDLTLKALFNTRGGLHEFAGTRVFILDAVSLADSRDSLIDTLGLVGTKRQFLAFGFRQGWRAASGMRVLNLLPSHRLTATVHRLLVLLGTAQIAPDVDPAPDDSTIVLHGSYEAEEQVRRWGLGSEPTCWFHVGFTSGYMSCALGRVVLCQEAECVACGAQACRLHVDALPDVTLNPLNSSAETGCAHLLRHLGVDDVLIPSTIVDDRPTDRVLVGMQSPRMRVLLTEAHAAAQVDSTVLITGESGSGKGQLARYIHDRSRRSKMPFLTVNCGALPDTLLESELFGHRRGAFTGAIDDRPGLFEAAAGGTIFLDEIGDLPTPMQVKLLHVLQTHEVRRLGDTRSRTVNVRVIAATNRDLKTDVATKQFREDLYYRLDVLRFHVPPLRERLEDLQALANLFLQDAAERMRKSIVGYTAGALERMMAYGWPGNIRELQNVIERMCALATRTYITLDSLPSHVRHAHTIARAPKDLHIRPLRQVEQEHIVYVLQQCGGNKTRAAAALGITQDTLHRKLRKYRRAESQPDSSD